MPTDLRRWYLATALVLAVILPACASRAVVPATPGVDKYPDFTYPAVPAALQRTPGAERVETGWRLLQAGDTRNAARIAPPVAGGH